MLKFSSGNITRPSANTGGGGSISSFGSFHSQQTMHETSNVLRAFDSNKNIINVNTEVLRSIRLHHILSNHKSLASSTQYLANEYSMECLLSLIESIQYQRYIFEHIQRNFEYLNLTRERFDTALN